MPELVINAREASIAEKLGVRRILPFRQKRMVGPFIFMDHAGPVDIQPKAMTSMDVLPHPHIGLSTVSYLFGGHLTHRDSLGSEQVILPGEVNWMTAGKGIAHSERFEDPKLLVQHNFEMIQTWVALPENVEECNPEFNNYKPEKLPVFTDKGIWMRLIAGTGYGLKGDVKTHSPLFYFHVELQPGAKLSLPTEHSERAAYVVKGKLEISGNHYSPGQMVVFKKNETPTLTTDQPSTIMLLGGEPLGERFIWWNFVSSKSERIEQAKEDWKAGRIVLPPNDDGVFIPLPDFKGRPVSGGKTPEPGLLS